MVGNNCHYLLGCRYCVSLCHEVNTPLVGIPYLDDHDNSISALLRRTIRHYWIPIQHPTCLPDAGGIYVSLLFTTPYYFLEKSVLTPYFSRFPGKPLANLYFTCFTYNAMQMGQLLARDLKLAQYVHLSPRHTFTIQVTGCLVGAVMNYAMMIT